MKFLMLVCVGKDEVETGGETEPAPDEGSSRGSRT
jgi:hypothetical protein